MLFAFETQYFNYRKKMTNPVATVIVTAFDREESLKNLLEGLNRQTANSESYEVIVADDSGETCLGQRIINDIKSDYELSLVQTGLPYDVNGVSIARNKGIEKARGKLIISIDDDCLPCSYFVEEHIAAHQRPYPSIVLGHRSEQKEKLQEKRPLSVTESKSISELVAGRTDQMDFSNFMTGNVSFPKQLALDIGLFDESFAQPGEHGWEDIELGYRFWRKGIPTLFARNAMIYRPVTEKEKQEKRKFTKAMEKAAHRFVSLQPLVPWVNQFHEAIRQNKNDLAIEIGEKILKDDPEHCMVLTKQAELYTRKASFDHAETLLLKALQINNQNPFFYQKLAEIKYQQEKDDEAIEYLIKSLELDPNRTRALYLLTLMKPFLDQNQIPSHLRSREINIKLGGGIFPTKLRDEGQDDFINLDTLNWPTVDAINDLTQPVLLPDNSANRIFSREMIEHLPHNVLPGLIGECFRVLKPGGNMYLSCPDFEAIVNLFHKKCGCVIGNRADPSCPLCEGCAEISEDYWRSNLIGDQTDYGDGGINDTHKNQITFSDLKKILKNTGFVNIKRDPQNRFYEKHKRNIKLSVSCMKP
jgi:glycosyltransferase involved in cell wall biosynthesis